MKAHTSEDLSASIFQAVVNQTISGLACGKPIRGNVAFLGGPLHFLSELKEAFIRTLNLDRGAYNRSGKLPPFCRYRLCFELARKRNQVSIRMIFVGKLKGEIHMEFEVKRMDPLFADQADYDEFTDSPQWRMCKKRRYFYIPVVTAILGIDAGSTTTKVALVAEDGTLLYSFYSSNNGSPLATTIIAIKEIYEHASGRCAHRIFLLHRLRRGTGKSCSDAG